MEARRLYAWLEKDFIKPGITDDWIKYMKNKNFLSDNFKTRSMGVVCDNSEEIKRVYTAVFPTDAVLRQVAKTKDALLFVHHPEIWDMTKAPEVFQEMNPKLLEKLKQQRVSVYNLHTALDNYGKYSTSKCLAEELKITRPKPFAPYNGGLAGVFGTTKLTSTKELSKMFKQVLGHRVSLYLYGDEQIRSGRVAVVAGGGNDKKILKEIADNKTNTFVTGITALNSHSQSAHDFAKQHKINILGGTHYSTEKFACIAMCRYFENLGLPCRFIAGKPGLEDL